MSWRWVAATVCVLLVGFSLLRLTSYDVVVALATAGTLLVVGRRSGLSWGEMGLAPGAARRGAVWAGGALLVVAVGYTVIALTPLSFLLDDTRFDDGWPDALFQAFVLVPLGTVLWEEIGFRGVLWGQIRSTSSARNATIASSVLFGLWHAVPALRFAETSRATASVAVDSWAVLGTVVVTVLTTTVAGVVLCELRRRSDSLLAPIGLHWALNGIGILAIAASST